MKTSTLLLSLLVLSGLWLGVSALHAPPSSVLPSVDPSEIIYVVPQDAIPAITQPSFLSASETDFSNASQVVGVNIAGDARAYPIAILNWHEIVDDVVGGKPIAVTYCPLCGTGIVYNREVNSQILTFKVSGRLYKNDLVMYDNATGSYWTQAGAYSIAGSYAGTRLQILEGFSMSLGDWRKQYPNTLVLAKPVNSGRDYTIDPYASYKTSAETGLFAPKYADNTLHPKAYVVGITIQNESVAYPFQVLYMSRVIDDVIGDTPLVIIFNSQTNAVNVFDRRVSSELFTFNKANGDFFWDEKTNSTWNLLSGEAVDGPLKGNALSQASFITGFWFAWVDFHPSTRVFGVTRGAQLQGNAASSSILNGLLQIMPVALFVASLLGLVYLRLRHGQRPQKRKPLREAKFYLQST